MKQEIEQLIDRLASKELTFGCHIQEISPPDKKIQNREWIVLQQSADPSSKDLNCIETYFYGDIEIIKEYNILGHPILKCHVEQKILEADSAGKIDSPCTLIDRLTQLWLPCGFTKSLQEIYAEAEWEEVKNCKRCDDWYLPEPEPHDCEKEIVKLVPKQPHIREFFQFLLQLGL